ncbi:MAG: DUF5683 domain-containing protein [Candidatus Poribacteria bacterium]|nr:DUF5683 domain-containing protein [Candidatus Poribacteria bacterium]
MHKNNTDIHSGNSIYTHRNTQIYTSRSYVAMILSAFIPGLGQIYLHQVAKGCFIFFLFVSALGLFYINSYPVRELDDLLRFQPKETNNNSSNSSLNTDTDHDNSIQIWTLEDGKTLMFRPSWFLKVTAVLQALICWIYAMYSGWYGRSEMSVATSEFD